MLLTNAVLLSLSEVCATFTGFIGIVVVLGRRAEGSWNAIDDIRFRALITSSVTPVALSLLPILFGPNSFVAIGLIVGGASFSYMTKQALRAFLHPEGNTKLASIVTFLSIVVMLIFIGSIYGFVPMSIHQSYLGIILFNLAISVIFFVRLIKISRSQR
jgi:hypothetical protein